jgi:hypothetical protein
MANGLQIFGHEMMGSLSMLVLGLNLVTNETHKSAQQIGGHLRH